jgi:hypothetical protein
MLKWTMCLKFDYLFSLPLFYSMDVFLNARHSFECRWVRSSFITRKVVILKNTTHTVGKKQGGSSSSSMKYVTMFCILVKKHLLYISHPIWQ